MSFLKSFTLKASSIFEPHEGAGDFYRCVEPNQSNPTKTKHSKMTYFSDDPLYFVQSDKNPMLCLALEVPHPTDHSWQLSNGLHCPKVNKVNSNTPADSTDYIPKTTKSTAIPRQIAVYNIVSIAFRISNQTATDTGTRYEWRTLLEVCTNSTVRITNPDILRTTYLRVLHADSLLSHGLFMLAQSGKAHNTDTVIAFELFPKDR